MPSDIYNPADHPRPADCPCCGTCIHYGSVGWPAGSPRTGMPLLMFVIGDCNISTDRIPLTWMGGLQKDDPHAHVKPNRAFTEVCDAYQKRQDAPG